MPDLLPPNDASHPDGHAATWDALARFLAGESTEAEAVVVRARLAEHPRDAELIEALDRMLASAPAANDIDVETALRTVNARRVNQTPPLIVVRGTAGARSSPSSVRPAPRWRVPFPAIAAAALLTVGFGGWLASRNGDSATAIRTVAASYVTRVGQQDSVRLPDGTLVVLGPQSSMRVAGDFGGKNREVTIIGEAYFDVTHDDARPFVVRAGSASIRDVGTRFVVRSDDTDGIFVAVTEGIVALTSTGDSATGEVILQAGDRSRVRPSGKTTTRRGDAGPDDLAWMRGSLVFREAPITEVIASLRRWYGIELRVADATLGSRHITATFSGETRERVLEVIALALGADVERRGDTAFVRQTRAAPRKR